MSSRLPYMHATLSILDAKYSMHIQWRQAHTQVGDTHMDRQTDTHTERQAYSHIHMDR